jgi:uncharacterized protein with HEPN domain
MAASKNPKARLLHILEEIDGVAATIKDMDYTGYRDSYIAVRVVERALEIISEAARALPDAMTSKYPYIEWARIRSIGNFLRHEYHQLDTHSLWDVATDKLVELRPVIIEMLGDIERREQKTDKSG